MRWLNVLTLGVMTTTSPVAAQTLEQTKEYFFRFGDLTRAALFISNSDSQGEGPNQVFHTTGWFWGFDNASPQKWRWKITKRQGVVGFAVRKRETLTVSILEVRPELLQPDVRALQDNGFWLAEIKCEKPGCISVSESTTEILKDVEGDTTTVTFNSDQYWFAFAGKEEQLSSTRLLQEMIQNSRSWAGVY